MTVAFLRNVLLFVTEACAKSVTEITDVFHSRISFWSQACIYKIFSYNFLAFSPSLVSLFGANNRFLFCKKNLSPQLFRCLVIFYFMKRSLCGATAASNRSLMKATYIYENVMIN